MIIVCEKTERKRCPLVMGRINSQWDDWGVLIETLLFTSGLKGPGERLSVCLGENPPKEGVTHIRSSPGRKVSRSQSSKETNPNEAE